MPLHAEGGTARARPGIAFLPAAELPVVATGDLTVVVTGIVSSAEVRVERDIEVLVVGAGPVGLTTAIALRRLGMQVRIVDRASGANREPRADVLFPRAGEALGAIGVGQRIQDCSYQMQGAEVYGDGRRVASFQVGRLAS